MRSTMFQSSVVVETLQCLEVHFTAHRGHLAQVAAALSGGQFAPALDATDKLREALGAVDALYKRLYANVVPVDGFGHTVESVGELCLRARRMVIQTQLGRLRDLLQQPEANARVQGWFVGDFQSIDDVDAYFEGHFGRINSIWMQYRQIEAEAAGMLSTERVTLYRASIRVAQRALRDLRQHPDLSRLLHAGLDAVDWPEVYTAFTEIAVALAVQIDTESGRVPLVPRPAVCASGTIPAREQ